MHGKHELLLLLSLLLSACVGCHGAQSLPPSFLSSTGYTFFTAQCGCHGRQQGSRGSHSQPRCCLQQQQQQQQNRLTLTLNVAA
jgi:hypothetical protein